MLLPATALLQKEMLEISRDSILEKIEKFWEKMRGIYKNNNPEQEGPRGTGPSRGNGPAQPVLPPVVFGAISTDIQTINYDDGRVYRGHVRNGQPWGSGTMEHPDETRHSGMWRDGLEDGRITVFYPPHRLIESQTGLWRDGMQEQVLETRLREGVILMPQGYYWGPVNADNQPDTSTEDGSEEEPAILEYFSGHRYEGEFARGLRFGAGIMHYQNGFVYEGQWAYDEKDGQGVLYLTHGIRIEAHWQNNQIAYHEAMPVVYYADGKIYEGQLSKDYFIHGVGTMFHTDGSWVTSTWNQGIELNGNGTLVYPNSIYTGQTYGGVPHGTGTLQEDNLLYSVIVQQGALQEAELLLEVGPMSPSVTSASSAVNSCDSSFDFNSSAASSSSQ